MRAPKNKTRARTGTRDDDTGGDGTRNNNARDVARNESHAQKPRLAFAAIAQRLPFEDLRALLQHAEALGYEAAYLDGDLSMLPGHAGEVLDGWLVQSALAAASTRIRLAAMRLPHHWNVARLAQAVATFERLHPGRQRLLFAVGGQPVDARFGLPWRAHSDRVAALDEMLRALRALLAGEEVTVAGRFVQLDRAQIRPALRGMKKPSAQSFAPPSATRDAQQDARNFSSPSATRGTQQNAFGFASPPTTRDAQQSAFGFASQFEVHGAQPNASNIPPPPMFEIGGAHPRTLLLVAAYADAWNINLPPVPELVARADAALARACAQVARAPSAIERSLWLFARPACAADDPRALAEFRALNPWFARVPDAALADALLVGGAQHARARLAKLRAELRLDLPVLDVTGLALDDARRALDVFAA